MLKIVQQDTVCGFSSGVQPVVQGEVGDRGTAVWTVTDCEVAFDHEDLETDCLGEVLEVDGAMRITATKTVTGWVTGDPETPIIPETEDAARIAFTAELDGFVVKSSSGPEYLRMKSGAVSVVAQPRLALEQESGACSVATPDVRFDEIVYEHAKLQVSSPDRSFDVSVPISNFGAQSGVGLDQSENQLWGELTVWDDTKSVEGNALDPDYDAETYRDSYTCMESYVLPISRDCALDAKLANGTARLILRHFGVLGTLLDEDDDCGFGSLSGLMPDDIDGIPVLDDKVTATWRVSDCTLGGVESAIVETDCNGKETVMSGAATATAKKIVVGELAAGNPPIVPKGRREATVEVQSLILANLEIREQGAGASDAYLVVEQGTLRGVALPVTGEAANDHGSYYIKTPVAEFSEIALDDATVVLHSGAKSFRLHIEDAVLNGFNGSYLSDTNWIEGSLKVDGLEVTVAGELDEEYEQERFDASYVCIDNLREVVPAGD
jgi:hypothetical protein